MPSRQSYGSSMPVLPHDPAAHAAIVEHLAQVNRRWNEDIPRIAVFPRLAGCDSGYGRITDLWEQLRTLERSREILQRTPSRRFAPYTPGRCAPRVQQEHGATRRGNRWLDSVQPTAGGGKIEDLRDLQIPLTPSQREPSSPRRAPPTATRIAAAASCRSPSLARVRSPQSPASVVPRS